MKLMMQKSQRLTKPHATNMIHLALRGKNKQILVLFCTFLPYCEGRLHYRELLWVHVSLV